MRGLFTRLIAALVAMSLATPAMAQIDPTARGIAAKAKTSTDAQAQRLGGTVAMRLFGGRVGKVQTISNGNANGRTFEVLMTTAVPFDAVRIVLAVSNTSSANAIPVSVYAAATAVADTSDATIGAATWVQAGFGGTNDYGGGSPATLTPAATNARRSFLVSDIMPVSSVARTDGGTYPLLVMRAHLFQATGADGNIVISGNGTQSFANWATRPDGRIWRMTDKGGGFAASAQSGMTSANSAVGNGSPIAGVIYYARGKVVNVAGFGDSITEGQGSYVGEGFGFPATQALTATGGGVAYEWSDLGWAGQSTSQIWQNLIDTLAVPAFRFDVAVLPDGSPNDVSTTIDATTIASMRRRAVHMTAMLQAKGIQPVLWTWLPSNPAVKTYGASDSLRVAFNNDYRGWAARGGVIADFAATLSGTTDANGQVGMRAGTTSDDIHPNDAGNALLAPVLVKAISRVAATPSGTLAQ